MPATNSHHPMWTTPLTAVYQDNSMLVIVKPQGMTVMGASPSLCRSDLLMAFKSADGLRKPVPVHRLDAPTGGLLVVAKTRMAEVHLKGCFAKRNCRKRYRALVIGKVDPLSGECHIPMGGRGASTEYAVVRHVKSVDHGWVTLLDLFPITGRKHQLRKHMKALGHPIWGDRRYGRIVEGDELHSRLCLWHMEITVPHPVSEERIVVTINEPEWLVHVLEHVEKRGSEVDT